MKLVLGAAQFGMDYGIVNSSRICSKTELRRILELSLSCGISEIDTAISYGNSETNLGIAGVKRFKVSSKIPYLDNYRYGDLNKLVTESLRRLSITALDILYLHDDRNAENIELVSELDDLKKVGKIQRTGVSVYAEDSSIKSFQNFDVVQCQGNAFDRVFVRYAKTLDVVYLRSLFLQGLLLCEVDRLPEFLIGDKELFKAWERYCEAHAMSKLEMSFYNVSKSGAHAFLVGVSSHEELKQIVLASESIARNETIPLFHYEDVPRRVVDPRRWA